MTVGPTENRREWESSTPERNAELIAAANANIAVLQSLATGEISDVEAAGLMSSFEAGPKAKTTGAGTGSRSRAKPTTYNKKAADALLEEALLDALNIVPDAKTKAEFFKGLNAFLKAYGSTSGSSSTGTGSSTSYSIQGADASVYIKEFVKEVVKDRIKTNPNEPLGGKVGDTIRALSSYAADMGVFKSSNEITNKSVDVITGASRQEDILASYRKDAQALYSNFAPRLAEDAGLTVRDLANPYIQMMADIFELSSDNIKLTDDTIQKAINDSKGLINLGQFRTMLRNDKRFETTSTAKREAAGLSTAMLRSFGFGA
jgi:hypothetical protein